MAKSQAKGGFTAYFNSPAGRKTVFLAAGATTVGFFVGNFLPHSFGLQYYKNFISCYENGIERKVAPEVLNRIEMAYDKLNVKPYERKIIKPFSVFGFDLFQAGSTKYRFGALLGIPINYSYASVNDINRTEIFARDKQIDWSSEQGKLLQEALVLSEDEQIFGLCKSILQLQTHRVLLNSLFPSVAFLSVYSIGHYLNQKLMLLTKPLSLRLVMYSILGLFGLGSWSFMKDYNQVTYDANIDKQLAELGPEFIQAGVRFYDKILKKNIALRALIGDDIYTAKGNENYLLRQKSLPLTIRKSFFDEKWRELNETQAPREVQ